MLKVGLVGIGFMGRGHIQQYKTLESEGCDVKLTAICDVDKQKLKGKIVYGNIDVGKDLDLSGYAKYDSLETMLKEEDLDYVDIALPTYMHAQASVMALKAGKHVLCEKPMALNEDECEKMIEASRASGKKLMIAQCLRFWPMYEVLKSYVDSGEFGKAVSAYFFRGGATPIWSYKNWLLRKNRSGGALLDQHVHDIDMIQYLFGMPKSVSTSGRNVIEGSGYDAVSTNYYYHDGKVVNAQDDWTINGEFPFTMLYRVNFEHGAVVCDGKTIVYPQNGEKFEPELKAENGYYHEIKYFIDCVANNKPICTATMESTAETIRLARAELRSARKNGTIVKL